MRHLTPFVIFGFLTGCAAHTDPAPPGAPEDPQTYPTESQAKSDPSGATSTYPRVQAGTPSTPSDTPSAAVNTGVATAAIDANLDRLKALKIFEVGALLLPNLPAEANCYGLPCPGQEQQFADGKEAQAKRLADFADTTVNAAAKPASYDVVTPAVTEQNLDVLRTLNIVVVGALIVDKPVITGNCYGACAEDIAACDAINNDRANRLSNIAKAF
jgi:hypothetical protein